MTNVTESIRTSLSEIAARIERLQAELAKANAEQGDLQTTLRVLDGFKFGDEVQAEIVHRVPKQKRPAAEKKKLMLECLGVGMANGKGPAVVHKELLGSGIDDINIGTVRTTLWRLAQNGELESAGGDYWKLEAEDSLLSESSAQNISNAGITTGGTQPIDRSSDQEVSHDAS